MVMNRQAIGERLKQSRENANISRKEASEAVGIGTTTLQQWEVGNREASIETLAKLAQLYKISLQWLIFGDTGSTATADEHTAPITPPTVSSDEYSHIPAYNIQASAGHGSFINGETPTKHLAFRKRWLTARGLHAKNLAALFTKGDSMEPTIPDGSAIVIDKSRTTALDGKLYVIRIDDRLYVKRTQWIPTGGLRLISDNKAYDSFDITKDDMQANDIEVCGQVIHASFDLPD